MLVKGIVYDDYVNYKKCSMFIGFPSCTFKCCIDAGRDICQNSQLAKSNNIDISYERILGLYKESELSQAIVCGGLEPFDSFDDLCNLIKLFRDEGIDDEFVIYTGYKEEELGMQLCYLSKFKNIIVKFGRYIPNSESIYDDILGVTLASKNQYAKVVS